MKVGDRVRAEHDGEWGYGFVEAISGDRVFLRLTIRRTQPGTSPFSAGTVPAGCPLGHLLWLPITAVHPA
jgi:hypothetical protein